jgi:two-component system cell cycle response regulator
MSHILIVDDSAAVRGLVTQMLVDAGHSVACAPSGEEAAAMALSEPFDAVVSDLWMPGVSGLQMCRVLREDSFTRELPIVLFTVAGDAKTRFWAESSGADAVLEKRCVRDLPRTLSKLLAGRPPRPAVSRNAPVHPSAIPARLGHLLERKLFQSVLSSHIRGLALDREGITGFFEGLADLTRSVMSHRWLGLTIDGAAYVQASAADFAATDLALAALRCPRGAPTRLLHDDRCSKPISGPVLTAEVVHAGQKVARLAVELAHDQSEPEASLMFQHMAREVALPLRLASLVEATQKSASTDELTKLSNRRGTIEFLERTALGATRHHLPLSVALFDIDLFKRVNDTHGHIAGDAALRHVASILQRCARKSDLVGRWGGEEFLVVLPSTGAAGARIVAERLRAAIACAPVTTEDGKRFPVTISGGVATLVDESWQSLVDRADQGLYVAKERGRDRVEVADKPERVPASPRPTA